MTIKAFDTSFVGEITSTIFKFSDDGVNWIPIGTDNFGGLEGHILPEWHDKKFGSEGWSINWDLTGLAEGPYFIKATMESDVGETVNYTQEVYYDPLPPIPTLIHPLDQQPVSWDVDFVIETDDPDCTLLELLLFDDDPLGRKDRNGGWYNQSGLGTCDQSGVGPNGNDGTNRWCGPTAVANALKGQNDSKLYPPGKNGNVTAR